MKTKEALETWFPPATAPLDRIVVPMDGSASAERILFLVRALLAHHASSVILARTIEPPSAGSLGVSLKEAVEIAELYLKQVAGVLRGSCKIEVRTAVRIGPAPETILAVVEEEAASLIAMSTHGRLTPSALPFGPVAERLIRSSPVPILALPAHVPEAKDALPERPFRTLLIPFPDEDAAPDIISSAVDFALSSGADLAVLLRIVPSAETGRGEAEKLARAEAYLRRIAGPLVSRRIPTVPVVRDGDPVAAVLAVAQERPADVILLSTRRGDPVDEPTRRILKSSTVPVLLARSRAPAPNGPL